MKFKWIIVFIFLTLNNAIFAFNSPEKCPTPSVISDAGFDMSEIMDGRRAVGNSHNYYDTKEEWSFLIGFFDNLSQKDAFLAAKKSLSQVIYQFGPAQFNDDTWYCGYITSDYKVAKAVTPSQNKVRNLL